MKPSKKPIQKEPMIKPEYIVCFGLGFGFGLVTALIIVNMIK